MGLVGCCTNRGKLTRRICHDSGVLGVDNVRIRADNAHCDTAGLSPDVVSEKKQKEETNEITVY
jgi:hypothetical protein